MKFTKYIAAGMIALAGLTSCSESFMFQNTDIHTVQW